MKVLLSFVFLVLCLAILAYGRVQTDKNALQSTLVGIEKQSWEAWKNRDADFFRDFLSDDHVEMGAGGPSDKATVVAGVASKDCVVKSYAVDHFVVTAFNADTALLTYRAAQETTCFGNAVPSPAWVSSLFIRRDGRWRNALYQRTLAPK